VPPCIRILGTWIAVSNAVAPAVNVMNVFNFVGIREMNTIGAMISNTTWVSKLLSGLENKLKGRIKNTQEEQVNKQTNSQIVVKIRSHVDYCLCAKVIIIIIIIIIADLIRTD